MQRNRIVDAGANRCLSEVCLQSPAILHAHHVEVIHTPCPGCFPRHNDGVFGFCEELVVAVRELAARLIPLSQAAQFHGEHSSLNRIEAPVIALDVVVIFLRLPVVSNHLHALRHSVVVSRDRPGFAACAEVLSRIKAESRGAPHRPCLLPHVVALRKIFCAVSLASILDNNEVVARRQLHDGVHVGSLPVEVNRNNCRNRALRPALDQLPSLVVEFAMNFEVFAQLFRVHRICGLVDIYEGEVRTGLGNRFGRRNKRVRHGNNDVSLLNTRRHEGKAQRIGAAVHADALLRVAKLRKLAFKFFEHRAANESCSVQRLLNDFEEFCSQLLMRGNQIKEWNFRCANHLGYFFSSEMNRRNFAGLPATIALAGTSFVTTLPAPTIAFSPIVSLLMMVEPEPIEAPLRTIVFSTFQSASVCSPPSEVVARG